MKTEFKAKFLQYVANRKKEEGFTLIELLVVIIIIGILAAIALPSFLSQANKAKQSEAKQYIASINKGQQAYYTEKGVFVTAMADITNLGLGIKTATTNYTYALGAGGPAANSGVSAWTAKGSKGLKGYAGLVFLTGPVGSDKTSQSIICQADTVPNAALSATVCAGSNYPNAL